MNKNRAQSILELVAMIMFVAATIFIGGPTIIRGINAHFKLWDDSVRDTYNDPLKQGSPQNLPTDCICDPPIGGPGLRCDVDPCPPTQRLVTVLCNPVGCGAALGITESTCVDDPTCCDRYIDMLICGTGGPAPDCPVGERRTQRACGGGINEFSCRTDHDGILVDGNVSCVPHCIGPYNANETVALSNPLVPVICPGDDVNVLGSPWVQDASGIGIPITILGHNVAVCNHPTPTPLPDNSCEAYCLPGYIHQGAGCVPNFCRTTFTTANTVFNDTNDASFSICEVSPVGSANMVGCATPSATPGFPCQMNILPVGGGPGFPYCQLNYTVAAVPSPNGTNNQNFSQCEADTITTTTNVGAGCGNPGVPSSACVLQIQ
jgi:hypothetical protein